MYKSEVDASLVLANALQEIDGIIAETEMELKNSFESSSKKDRFNNLLEELIEITKEDNIIEIDTRKNLIIWLRELNRQNFSNKENNGSMNVNNLKTSLLESELSVLKEQVEAQQDKIKEFEVKISELQAMLVISENSYQEVFKQKFKVEDEKFNLLNELSRIKTINDDKIRLLESEISFLKKTLLERETETASLRLYLAKIVRASNHLLTENELDTYNIFSKSSDSISKKLNENRKVIMDKPPIVPRNHFSPQTQHQFKDSSLTGSFTMPSTSSNNKQSAKNIIDTKNDFLEKSYSSILNNRCLSPINRLDLATSKEQLKQFCKKEIDVFYDLDKKHNHNYISTNNYLFLNQSPSSTCSTSNRSAKSNSSPLSSQNNTLPKLNNSGNYSSNINSYLLFNSKAYSKSSSISNDNIVYSKKKKNSSFKNKSYSLNLDSFKKNSSQTNLYFSPSISSNFSSISGGSIRDIFKPRPLSISSSSNSRNFIFSLGRNLWFKKASRCSSAPELADDSKLTFIGIPKNSNPDLPRGYNKKENDSFSNKDNQKSKGLKWFFEKMMNKSQNNNELSFSRTSLRATTGPQIRNLRLKQDMDIDFKKWNSSILSDWVSLIGLGNYSEIVLNSNLNGEKLLSLNDVQLEKILQIKNHFHRKKLKLAINCIANSVDKLTLQANKLDYLWVAKWLDDIGLPQYKEIFLENRIDGTVLHYLTTEDLCKLKINTQLHHSSIKTGIFVLRNNNFDPNCLKRRASPENSSFSYDYSKSNDSNNSLGQTNISSNEKEKRYSPEKVELWTLHRVMEWLRSIDLSEFVANLRGSGVHGSLFINEDCFNSNVLATLLSIPPSKTLLRRHINTYFNQLVGSEISLRKREYQERLGSSQLSAFTKIRIPKKSNFRSSFRKKKNEVEDDLVCPLTFPLNNLNKENHTNSSPSSDKNVSKENFKNNSINQSLNYSNKSFIEKNENNFITIQNNSSNEILFKENKQNFLDESFDNSSVNEPESHV